MVRYAKFGQVNIIVKKCGSNFDDDCKDWDKKFQVYNSLKWLKEEFKRKYHIDYDKIKKKLRT